MTQKLYDNAPYGKTFTARVLSCTRTADGYETVLDATLFFPEEGGQCSDTGTLNGVAVTHAALQKDGTIVHRTAAFLEGEVTGVLDWPARFRNMQHHTGEHILSGLFDGLYGYQNVGFHLGRNEVTLDVGGPLTAEQIATVEQRANEILWEDRPVTAYYPDAQTLANLTYRAKRESYDHTRIVSVEGVDTCACCAPHVSSTGQIGCIKVTAFAKNKNATRLWIVCGGDALAHYRTVFDQATAVSRLLKVPAEQIGNGAQKLLTQLKEQSFRLGAETREVLALKLQTVAASHGSLCLVCGRGNNDDMTYLLNLAKEKAGQPIAVLWGNETDGFRFQLYGAPDKAQENAALIARLGGNGGGKNGFYQGKMNTTTAALEQVFERVILF